MRTAAQHNAPLVGTVEPLPLSADEIRSKLIEQFEAAKPHLAAYHEYAERCIALSLAYHNARIAATFAGVPVEELTVAATLDARETPKSLDTKLAQLHGVAIKRIIFDPVKSTYLLFV